MSKQLREIKKIKRALASDTRRKVIVLDGAIGTQLHKRGMPAGVCPEAWCIENPQTIASIHKDYVQAGSDIVYTATFGGNQLKLKQFGNHDVYRVNKQLAKIARRAVGSRVLVAGDIGPTGQFVQPFGSLAFDDAVRIFTEQVRGLRDGGADLFVIETMMDVQEARAALVAVKEFIDAFVLVSMTFERGGRTLNGTDVRSALITLQGLGADAFGCNCSTGPEGMLTLVKQAVPYAKIPIAAKPNAGIPHYVDGKTVFKMGEETFGSFGRKFIAAGVSLLGGCCGTTPEHIRALSRRVCNIKPKIRKQTPRSVLSSAKDIVTLPRNNECLIIGERINPTGKKTFQRQLQESDFSYVREAARQQQAEGAALLDVNVGAPHINELSVMQECIQLLSTISDLPLVIDSSKPDVIESALRIYPGRALINSISGDSKKVHTLLSVAKKYGAMIILLPLTGKTLPELTRERIAIIRSLFSMALKHGFSRDDIVVDALALSISSHTHAVQETLKTIAWIRRVLKCQAVVGLSNVSFGLPQRHLLNATFLSMARKKDLCLAIADPTVVKLPKNKHAEDVLSGKDTHARRYIAYCAGRNKEASKRTTKKKRSIQDRIHEALLEGNRDIVVSLIREALARRLDPTDIVNDIMIPAITLVGEHYDKKHYFLPQLIASAETMQRGFAVLDPLLRKHATRSKRKVLILLATVAGDIHDIGKNIVALLLGNYGFEVKDLGKDVSTHKIITAIKKYRPAIVGLSALMTTTMVHMKDVIEAARKEGLHTVFLVGGAVVTDSFARSIGAEYARDGVAAVRVAQKING